MSRVGIVDFLRQIALEILIFFRLSRNQESDQLALLGGLQMNGLIFELRQRHERDFIQELGERQCVVWRRSARTRKGQRFGSRNGPLSIASVRQRFGGLWNFSIDGVNVNTTSGLMDSRGKCFACPTAALVIHMYHDENGHGSRSQKLVCARLPLA